MDDSCFYAYVLLYWVGSEGELAVISIVPEIDYYALGELYADRISARW